MADQELDMTSGEFEPQQDFILIKPVELKSESVTESGIYVIQELSVVDRPQTGEVLSVGNDCTYVKVGDEVLFPQTDGIDFKFSDGLYSLYREKSVIGICRRK